MAKIHVSASLLPKPALLTPKEFDLVKSHAAWGAKILQPLKEVGIESIVRHHHERYDSTGHPGGLAGGMIPLGARIIAVADPFLHNMVCGRARIFGDALGEIRCYAGTQFDPKVVTAFLDRLKIHGDPREQQ